MKTISRASIFFILVLFVSMAKSQSSPATDPELVRLRQEYAARFLEPGPHMQLAKYFRAKGNRLQAFYILESARRYRFDQKTFDAAYLLHFGGFAPLDNSPAEEAKYLQLWKASPNDPKIAHHLADIYISRTEYAKGEPYLLASYKQDPKSFSTLQALEELYDRLEKPEKGKKLVEAFERDHPTSAGGYILRLGRMLGNDPENAKKLLTEALAKYPDEGYFHYVLGAQLEVEKRLDEAQSHYRKATELDKNSKRYHAAMARFLRVQRKDDKRAIEYYLNVYFLDPHAHYDGHAEAKVAGLNSDVSNKLVEGATAEGKDPEQFLDDPNPVVVGIAMIKYGAKWDSTKAERFLRLLRHDDTYVRWGAMLALTEEEGRNLDGRLKSLLVDPDARVRGLAAYMAVKLWKNESFPEIRKLLDDDSQILRFDAVSALMLHGGPEGRQLVIEHRKKERNAYLNELIDASLKKEEPSN